MQEIGRVTFEEASGEISQSKLRICFNLSKRNENAGL
jgi:hypothetical protein